MLNTLLYADLSLGKYMHETPNSKLQTSNGFTLIELSIVLVIIGLLVGGVLAGQSLIWSATNRNIISLLEEYEQAYLAFRLKYNCIPGDCKKGLNFHSVSANGDGDGLIEWSAESANAMEAMTSAGLIPDKRWTPGSDSIGSWVYQKFPINKNVARLSIIQMNPTYWHALITHPAQPAPTRSGNAIVISGASQDTFLRLATMEADRMQAIDSAIDDGLPMSGKFQAFNAYTDYAQTTFGACVDTTNNVYLFADTLPSCQLVYWVE